MKIDYQTRIMNPTSHAKVNGINIPDNRGHDDDYIWRSSTIIHMLSKQEYLGHTVNFKTYRKIKVCCSSHQIRNVVVEELLLDGIRRVTAFAE